MARRRSRKSRPSRRESLDLLAGILSRVTARAESRRAFSCAGCDAHCCRVGRNGMLVTRLEAEAIVERMDRDPDLSRRRRDLERRVAAAARRLRKLGDEDVPTYDCPFLGEGNRCLVHGRGQPLGCITFMPLATGRCDHHLDVFEEGFDEVVQAAERWLGGPDNEGTPLPIAVHEVLLARERGRIDPSRGTTQG